MNPSGENISCVQIPGIWGAFLKLISTRSAEAVQEKYSVSILGSKRDLFLLSQKNL